MKYGLQMYSVRDAAQGDLLGTLEKVGKLGYHYAEFAGFFGIPAEQVKAKLDECGMEVSSTHTGWQELTEDRLEETIKYHKTIGNKFIIIPGADLSTQEKLDEFIALVNKVQPVLAAEGIRLGYHNHAHEFKVNEDGSHIYDQIKTRTNMELEIDTYWAYVGKQDPIAMMHELKDRVHMIHIKDGDADGHGTPLGLGTAPAAEVYKTAVEMGIQMIVESETCKPSGLDEARVCIEFLKEQEKKLG